MRTTIDIPDPIYRELKTEAAREGTSIRKIILRKVLENPQNTASTVPVRKLKYPLVPSRQKGSMKLGEEGVYEYISFP